MGKKPKKVTKPEMAGPVTVRIGPGVAANLCDATLQSLLQQGLRPCEDLGRDICNDAITDLDACPLINTLGPTRLCPAKVHHDMHHYAMWMVSNPCDYLRHRTRIEVTMPENPVIEDPQEAALGYAVLTAIELDRVPLTLIHAVLRHAPIWDQATFRGEAGEEYDRYELPDNAELVLTPN